MSTKVDYKQLGKRSVHCKCDGCGVEQLGEHGWKCWKCPKGYMRFIGGDVIKQRLLEAHGGNSRDGQKVQGRAGGGDQPSGRRPGKSGGHRRK
jgi:hypothetical protein